MRPIVALLAFLAALAGCQADEDSRIGPLADRVTALEGEVGSLPPPTDNSGAIRSLGERVAAVEDAVKALQARPAVKVPHLIAFSGIPGEEQDLGPFAAWDVAWSDELGTYYRSDLAQALGYAEKDCRGPSFASTGPDPWPYVVTTAGKIGLRSYDSQPVDVVSYWQADGTCGNGQAVRRPVFQVSDTGVRASVVSPRSLSISLR